MNISAERFTATFKYDELWINKKDISKVELIEWLNGMKESVDSEDIKSWYEILIGDIERLFPIVNERKDLGVNEAIEFVNWISENKYRRIGCYFYSNEEVFKSILDARCLSPEELYKIFKESQPQQKEV